MGNALGGGGIIGGMMNAGAEQIPTTYTYNSWPAYGLGVIGGVLGMPVAVDPYLPEGQVYFINTTATYMPRIEARIVGSLAPEKTTEHEYDWNPPGSPPEKSGRHIKLNDDSF